MRAIDLIFVSADGLSIAVGAQDPNRAIDRIKAFRAMTA